jgi:hypothetical protein
MSTGFPNTQWCLEARYSYFYTVFIQKNTERVNFKFTFRALNKDQ